MLYSLEQFIIEVVDVYEMHNWLNTYFMRNEIQDRIDQLDQPELYLENVDKFQALRYMVNSNANRAEFMQQFLPEIINSKDRMARHLLTFVAVDVLNFSEFYRMSVEQYDERKLNKEQCELITEQIKEKIEQIGGYDCVIAYLAERNGVEPFDQ